MCLAIEGQKSHPSWFVQPLNPLQDILCLPLMMSGVHGCTARLTIHVRYTHGALLLTTCPKINAPKISHLKKKVTSRTNMYYKQLHPPLRLSHLPHNFRHSARNGSGLVLSIALFPHTLLS